MRKLPLSFGLALGLVSCTKKVDPVPGPPSVIGLWKLSGQQNETRSGTTNAVIRADSVLYFPATTLELKADSTFILDYHDGAFPIWKGAFTYKQDVLQLKYSSTSTTSLFVKELTATKLSYKDISWAAGFGDYGVTKSTYKR